MKRLIKAHVKPMLVLVFTVGCLTAHAQEQTQASEEERISNADLIKLATKAPFQENFTSAEDYFAQKDAWIAEYPDAYQRLSGSNQPNKHSDRVVEEQQIRAKNAWIATHQEEYIQSGGQVTSVNFKSLDGRE